MANSLPHSAVLDPEKKNERLIFPTKYGIPKSLNRLAIGQVSYKKETLSTLSRWSLENTVVVELKKIHQHTMLPSQKSKASNGNTILHPPNSSSGSGGAGNNLCDDGSWWNAIWCTPGDSKWPFYSLIGGHLTFEMVTYITIPKRSQRIAKVSYFKTWDRPSITAGGNMSKIIFLFYWGWMSPKIVPLLFDVVFLVSRNQKQPHLEATFQTR